MIVSKIDCLILFLEEMETQAAKAKRPKLEENGVKEAEVSAVILDKITLFWENHNITQFLSQIHLNFLLESHLKSI